MEADRGTYRDRYFDPDRPLDGRDQDRLGRRLFAESIAQDILAAPAESGFTVAVVGEWGSGKTSVLNMVADSLRASEDSVAILHFNPWLFSRADDLMTRFFSELGAQLGQHEYLGLKNVADSFAGLVESLAPLAPVPAASWVARLFGWITRTATRPRSLFERRRDLTGALGSSGSRIVVLIDDIDRLEAGEIREVMRLVRLTSDFPNLIFLLAFDRHRVAKALGDNGGEGRQYLEKLVQVSHDVPVANKATLTEMLIEGLNRLIDARGLGEPDDEVWAHVLYDVLRPLLGNPRDVKRYLNSLAVTLDVVGQEVALADLLGLEAIRILRPSAFEDLRAHGDFLAMSDSEAQLYRTAEDRERDSQELRNIVEHAAGDGTVIQSALRTLFPEAHDAAFGSYDGSAHSSGVRRRERRVASAPVLQTYLQAAVGEGALHSREVRELVDALAGEAKLSGLLDSFDDQRLEEALERLGDYEQDFSIDAVRAAIPVLANRMGRLSSHAAGPFRVAPRWQASLLIRRLLRRAGDQQTLATIIRGVLDRVDSLSASFALVSSVGHRGSMGQRLVSAADAAEVEEQLVRRLEAATSEELADEWDLSFITRQALSWLEGEESDRLGGRLREHLRDDRFVLTLLCTSVSYGYSGSRAQKLLRPWDTFVEAFGDQLAEATGRLAGSRLYQEATSDDQDTVDLARKYSAGERPEGWDWE